MYPAQNNHCTSLRRTLVRFVRYSARYIQWFVGKLLIFMDRCSLAQLTSMANTFFLLLFTLGFIIFLVYASIKERPLSKKNIFLSFVLGMVVISALSLFTGPDKITSDITRAMRNSQPKSGQDAYAVLFQQPIDSCMTVINFKDQVIPTIDCCIWMELSICPVELRRLMTRKTYRIKRFKSADSTNFLLPFSDKPTWWTPQVLGDSLARASVRFNEHKEQTIFFGEDSTRIYVCDQAL